MVPAKVMVNGTRMEKVGKENVSETMPVKPTMNLKERQMRQLYDHQQREGLKLIEKQWSVHDANVLLNCGGAL